MPSPLTERQEECLRLTAFQTDKEIAWSLGISESVVKKHIFEACRRLGVNRRKAALALLERNVPSPPKHPMADPSRIVAVSPGKTEDGHGETAGGASALDLGRNGGGAPEAVADIADRHGAGGLASGGPGAAVRAVARGSAARAAVSGLADGPGRRWGYRPPPDGLVRLLIIAALAVVMALATKAVLDLMNDSQRMAQAIDRAR
ncbi:MAG: hypothetical protein B7Z42_08710 [Brevundimonas sp. 12-68-7]|uniref:HTH luxR-type domain-containing protein n=1 Tax=Brevundimonas subvibrioides TaxID=74313 RepID=A0A258FRD9_9CAUL|nr:MAG: hypothetical protein B7Z42_08710 [Brevundimonas sp. 12-68-7]OYX34558.1 MAG: hypothetical protein B7Z01_05185 [Brevundimonas subvibrioides]